MRPYAFWRDPVWLAGGVLYAVNRWLVKPMLPRGEVLLRGHFNDALFVPCALPILVCVHVVLGVRAYKGPPTLVEVLLHAAIWGVVCEGVGPLVLKRGTADALDVVAYFIGGLIASAFWSRCDKPLLRIHE